VGHGGAHPQVKVRSGHLIIRETERIIFTYLLGLLEALFLEDFKGLLKNVHGGTQPQVELIFNS
jgi:hypothetical protein